MPRTSGKGNSTPKAPAKKTAAAKPTGAKKGTAPKARRPAASPVEKTVKNVVRGAARKQGPVAQILAAAGIAAYDAAKSK